MARQFQRRLRRGERPLRTELRRGDDPLAQAMGEILDEQERPPAPDHRERIGVEALSVVWQIGPAAAEAAGEIVALAPPADAPVRRVAERRIDRRARRPA